jgi:quercetin dioxygenase-like cupin family protein
MEDTAAGAAHAVGAGQGEALWFAGGLVEFKMTAEQAGGRFSLSEETFPRGIAAPLHVQPTDPETFYVLEGEMTFHAGGETMQASAGSFVHIPEGVPHAWRVDSERVRFLNLTTAQHERFFRAAGEPAESRELPQGGMDMDKIAAASAEHGVDIIGPPPF